MEDNFMPKNRPTINMKTLYYIAWKNLSSKKLRSILTISGIVIGIGSITFLISFGLGLQKLVTENVIGDKSIKAIDITSPNSKVLKLNDSFVNKVKGFAHIEKVGVEYLFPASVGLKGGGVDSVVYGIDANFQDLSNLTIEEGRLLKDEDNKSVLISKSALRAIGLNDAKKAINQNLEVIIPLQYQDVNAKEMRSTFKIVGIIDSGQNNEIFVPSAIFDVEGVESYKQVKVSVDDTKNITSVRKQIESNGFQTSSPIDTLDQINQLFKFFNIILAGFGAIGIIVAILGMFNTLTISLLERTKEIGLMITLGGRRRDMLRLFIIEAVLLSIIGASVGVGGAFIGSRIVNLIVNQNAKTRGINSTFEVFSLPLWLVFSLIIFMVLVGMVVAYFPARRAQKISPIDALRRE